MILDVCGKIIKNMQLKIASVKNDSMVFNQAILKIEDSFIKHESKMDQDKQKAIYDVLYEMGAGVNDITIYISELESEIEAMVVSIETIRDNVVGDDDV